jgi:TP901 family phage tail tape measure protein
MANNKETRVKFSLIDGVTAGLKRIRGGLGELTGSLTGIKGLAAGVAAGFAAWGIGKGLIGAVREAAALETAMSRVGAVSGVTGEKLRDLQTRVEAAAVATKRGTVEVAQTVEALVRAGLSAEDALGALEPTLNLARTAALSTGDAANLLADVLDQFGLAGSKAASVADTLAAAALASGTGVGQLAAGLEKVAPVARASGLSLEQTAAALGLMARNGQEGGKAGAALAKMLDDLRDPTSKFAKELAAAGIKTTDFGSVLTQLGGKGATTEKVLNSLSLKSRSALEALLREGGGNLKQLTELLGQSGGAAEKAANAMENTLDVALQNLGERWKDIKRLLVEPILTPLANELNNVAEQIINFSKTADFARLRDELSGLFLAGLKAAKEFVSGIDFTALANDIAAFARDASQHLRDFADSARDMAAGVETFFDGVSVAINGFKTGLNALEVGGIRVAEFVTRIDEGDNVLGKWNKRLRESAIAAEDELGASLDATSASLDDFNGVAGETSGAMDTVADSTKKAADGTRELADFSNVVSKATSTAADAIKKMGDAAEGDSHQLKAASTEAGKLSVEIARLNKEIAARIAAGKPFGDLTTALNEAETKLASLGEQGNVTGTQIAKGQDTATAATKGTAKAAQQAGEGFKEAAQGADQANAAMADGQRLAGEYSGGVMGLLTGLNQYFGSISEGARQFFVEAERSSVRASTSIRSFIQGILAAEEYTLRAVASQKQAIESNIATFDRLAQEGPAALEAVGIRANYTSTQLDAMAAGIRNGTHNFGLLNQADLSRLEASVQAASNKVRELEARAAAAKQRLEEMGESLQDQLDRNAGNEEAVAKREYERRLREIEQLSREGGKAAEAAAAAARQRADALYRDELARIHNQEREQVASDTRVYDARDRRRNGGGGGGGGGDIGPPPLDDDVGGGGGSGGRGGGGGGTSVGRGGIGGPTYNVTINGAMTRDINEFQRMVVGALRDAERQRR